MREVPRLRIQRVRVVATRDSIEVRYHGIIVTPDVEVPLEKRHDQELKTRLGSSAAWSELSRVQSSAVERAIHALNAATPRNASE